MELRTRTSEYVVRDDGIIVQRVVSRDKQTVEDARANIAKFDELAGGEPRNLLVDMAVPYSTGPGVRELYADPESARFIRALAMVTHSTTTTLIGNFFLKLNRPPYPCRMFDSETRAIAWLKTGAR